VRVDAENEMVQSGRIKEPDPALHLKVREYDLIGIRAVEKVQEPDAVSYGLSLGNVGGCLSCHAIQT